MFLHFFWIYLFVVEISWLYASTWHAIILENQFGEHGALQMLRENGFIWPEGLGCYCCN